MTIGEIIQRVISLYSKGVPTDECRLTPRHVYSKMLTARSRLLMQKHNKKQKLSMWDYQTLECVELIKAKPYECPCYASGCDVLRSKCKIPQPIMALGGPLIYSVTSVDGSLVLSEESWISQKYSSGNKYTKTKPSYMWKNGYIYVMGANKMKVISIIGVFEDPVEIDEYPCKACGDETTTDACASPLDREFPIEDGLLDVLVELCVQELVVAFSQAHGDYNNDNIDTNTPQTRQRQQENEQDNE